MNIAANIRSERKRRGWTQHELAARIGVYDCYVSRWEKGKAKPDTDSLIELRQVFGKSIDELMFGGAQAFLPYGGGSLAVA